MIVVFADDSSILVLQMVDVSDTFDVDTMENIGETACDTSTENVIDWFVVDGHWQVVLDAVPSELNHQACDISVTIATVYIA